jgi:hypothetical protein
MFKTIVNGQEGYFLTEEEHEQLENLISIAQSVGGSNANNS